MRRLIAAALLLVCSALAVGVLVETLNADRECKALRLVQSLTDTTAQRSDHGRRVQHAGGPSADFCVRVTLFFNPLIGPHWYHHGVEPSAAAATKLHAPALLPSLRGRSCLVVAPSRLVAMIEANRMVRLLFETILTHGAFTIAGYATSESNISMACVVGESHAPPLKFDWRDAAIVRTLAASRAAFHAACATPPARSPHAARAAVVYQRDYSRRLANVPAMVGILAREYGKQHVSVLTHDEEREPCELVRTVGQTDLWLSSHGFNSILAFLLPRGAAFVEVFPLGYSSDYYSQLAAGNGVATFLMREPGIGPSPLWHPLPAWVVHGFKDLPPCVIHGDARYPRWRPLISFLQMMQRTGIRMQDVAVNETTLERSLLAHRRATPREQGQHGGQHQSNWTHVSQLRLPPPHHVNSSRLLDREGVSRGG